MRILSCVAVFGALSAFHAQVACAEQHRVYAKKMLVIKNCSPHTLGMTAVQDTESDQQKRKHSEVAQFKLFQYSDTPVKELHVTIDTEEKVFHEVAAGNYTMRVLRNPYTEQWRFELNKGASC